MAGHRSSSLLTRTAIWEPLYARCIKSVASSTSTSFCSSRSTHSEISRLPSDRGHCPVFKKKSKSAMKHGEVAQRKCDEKLARNPFIDTGLVLIVWVRILASRLFASDKRVRANSPRSRTSLPDEWPVGQRGIGDAKYRDRTRSWAFRVSRNPLYQPPYILIVTCFGRSCPNDCAATSRRLCRTKLVPFCLDIRGRLSKSTKTCSADSVGFIEKSRVFGSNSKLHSSNHVLVSLMAVSPDWDPQPSSCGSSSFPLTSASSSPMQSPGKPMLHPSVVTDQHLSCWYAKVCSQYKQ